MNPAVSADTFLRELALAVARNDVGAGEPLPVVLAQEGVTQGEYTAIATNPQYTRYLDSFTRELKENGFSFAAKCRVLAEELLPTMYHIVKDPDQPAAARVKAIENLVTWADLKPKGEVQVSTGAGFSISISINGLTPTKITATGAADVTDVIPKAPPPPTLVLPGAPVPDIPFTYENRASKVLFDEPEGYAYAGDDVQDAPWL
jgi:hypothetical protein